MGFRPPYLRGPAPAAKAPAADAARAVRPVAERTEPRRSPEQALRTEETNPAPAGDAVGKAYQVFDRYLEEGREYAAGQSAWYSGQGVPPGIPDLTSLPNVPGLNGAAPPPEMLSAAMWLFDQLRNVPGAVPAIPAAAPAAAKGWPAPNWKPETFDDKPAAAAPGAIQFGRDPSKWDFPKKP